ncbi:type IV pilus biogenesis protein PilM [Herbaspirillum sp. RV1423]|uniref:type IV pilus biogenesis protein PilM n=1 Tax=Herbaspirillum sp. RV1423 TaxID=1443993 RepID=UPI0004BA2C6B|nr:hypothetical protein [Herbaspirillum sp. RV1423]
MWNIAILVVLVSVAGIYSTKNLQTLAATESRVAGSVASEMAIYRDAVVNYFTVYNLYNTSVSFGALKSSGMLPSWSLMFQKSEAPIWNNYRDAAGVIYIYATALPDDNILGELASLSHNSILAGAYRSSLSNLQSPVFGDTNIPVTALSGKSVPDGAPVWIAMTK